MLRTLLYLQEGDLPRLFPFFVLYFLLFTALSLADGMALALYVENVGASRLPTAYACVALANLVLMAGYILWAERVGSVGMFHIILGSSSVLFAAAWLAIEHGDAGEIWYVLVFAGREISFILFLMHFGTLLQDFFTREELNRVLAIIYSGGRIGGILGGGLLEHLAKPLGLLNLIWVYVALLVMGLGLMTLITRTIPRMDREEDNRGDPGVLPPRLGVGRDVSQVETAARTSMRGFLYFVWASPLLFWNTVTSVFFMLCRWILNFQYSTYFQEYFGGDEVALAQFLGRYTQIALAISLFIQLGLVNRMVAWIGVKGTHLVYSFLLVAGVGMNLLPMTLGMAVFARVVETELRFGLRNPIMQLITNKFAKNLRVRVRAWSFGVVTPLSTLASSVLLGSLVHFAIRSWVAPAGALCGMVYFLTCFGLYGSFSEKGRSEPG